MAAIGTKGQNVLTKKRVRISNATKTEQIVTYSKQWLSEVNKNIDLKNRERFESNNINADTQGDGGTVRHKVDNQQWKIPNPLHKFATYNTLFTLSGLTEFEIQNPKEYIIIRNQL